MHKKIQHHPYLKILGLLLFLVLQLSISSAQGQTKEYQNLIDTAVNSRSDLFIFVKPLTRFDFTLDKSNMRNYVEGFERWSSKQLDTAMFLQIIENSKINDSSDWKESELPLALLIHDRDEDVSKKYAAKKFSQMGKAEFYSIRKRINKFNSAFAQDREINYFTRPIFDNSHNFAVVQWDNGHSWLGGGGETILYEFKNNTWHKAGVIEHWKY